MALTVCRTLRDRDMRLKLVHLLLPLSIACSGADSTDPETPEIKTPDNGVSTGFLPYLPGDNQAFATAVSSAGNVVGWSTDGTEHKNAFYWDGVLRNLTPAGSSSIANAVSSGTPVY